MTDIHLPENTLLILCGPAGSGKSSFAKRHFSHTQVISSDECRALISDDVSNQNVSGHAFDLMHFIIEKRLLLGRFTVADATHLESDSRNILRKICRRYGFLATVIVFNISLDVCLDRNGLRTRKVPEEAVRRQHEMLINTLDEIKSEDYYRIYILNESNQDTSRIEISPRIDRKP